MLENTANHSSKNDYPECTHEFRFIFAYQKSSWNPENWRQNNYVDDYLYYQVYYCLI